MTGLASGLASQWVAQDEVTYGLSPTWASLVFTIFDSDSLELKKVPKQSAGIYAGALLPKAARRVVTEYSVQGGTVGDLPSRGLNKWLYRMFGSYGQTLAALTEDSSTGAYTSVHIPGALEGHTFALQRGVPDITGTVAPFTEVGMKVSEWEMSATMGEIAKWTMTMEGRSELAAGYTASADGINSSVPTLQTYAAPAGGVFYWNQGTVYYGGTASTSTGVTSLSSPTTGADIKSFSLKFSRPLDLERYSPELLGYRNEPLQNKLLSVTGQMVVEWKSANAYYAAFENDTATSIEWIFTGAGIGSGSDKSSFALLAANIRLEEGTPKITGPEVLTQTIPFTVLDDGVNNTLQATYWSLDTA
jgi:hypothetical protein